MDVGEHRMREKVVDAVLDRATKDGVIDGAERPAAARFAAFMLRFQDGVRAIEKERASIDRDEAEAIRAHADVMAKIADRRRGLHGRCQHALAEHHADPSGGSDSHDSCPTCGAQW